jgi:hypothetical protein
MPASRQGGERGFGPLEVKVTLLSVIRKIFQHLAVLGENP